jgi:copper oxidase (laccase) domain-containing protein
LPNHTKVKIAQPSELKADKSYIDLLGIVRAQLGCCDVPTNNIHDVGIDTVTSPEFASFRREKAPGRNFSFVARRPSKQ